jgi:hypothetical protein
MEHQVTDAVLDRLVEIARLIESHRTAIFLLELEQSALRTKLPAEGWKPPEVTPA